MTQKLLSELTKMDDVSFYCLEHHIYVSRMVRDIIRKNAIPEDVIAGKLGVPIKMMKHILNGSYPFDLRILSKIQAYKQELAFKETKLMIEADGINFPAYKYQYPVFVFERIEKLLSALENREAINKHK